MVQVFNRSTNTLARVSVFGALLLVVALAWLLGIFTHSFFAGIPPARTCMTGHSQIWLDSPMLEPVRESYRSGRSIPWTRVDDLPGLVHFDHGIHAAVAFLRHSCSGASWRSFRRKLSPGSSSQSIEASMTSRSFWAGGRSSGRREPS